MRTGILSIVALSVTVLAAPTRASAELPPVGTVVNKAGNCPVTVLRSFAWAGAFTAARRPAF